MSEIDFQTDSESYKKPDFNDVLATLQKEGQANESIIGIVALYGLSDLSSDQIKQLKSVWTELPSSYKHKLLGALNEASEANFELTYREIALLGLEDESAYVRAASIDLLWEDESVETMQMLLNIARKDSAPIVVARALVGLGKFILLGEYEEIPELIANEAQQLALKLHTDIQQPLEVRRRALEALANSSHPQKDKFIKDAYYGSEHLLKVSALFAMGRTCDEKWQDILLEELDGDDNELIYEAVRACGEIQLGESVRHLGKLTLDDDREIQIMAIWALGEIGGRHAMDILSSLQENIDDDELSDIIDEAIDVASFSLTGAMFDFDVDDDF